MLDRADDFWKLNFEAFPGTPEKLALEGRFEPLWVKWGLGCAF